jgi:hypothetical protein
MNNLLFDHAIRWQTLENIEHFDGVLYEILDDGLNVVATLSMQDFIDLYTRQMPPPMLGEMA